MTTDASGTLTQFENYQIDSIDIAHGYSELSLEVSFNGQGRHVITLLNIIQSNFSRESDTEPDCIYLGEVVVEKLSKLTQTEYLEKLGYGFVTIKDKAEMYSDQDLIYIHFEGAIVLSCVCEAISIKAI